jgi:hypothetical protein
MEYRQLGRTDLRPGAIGLGVEHLNGQPPQVVREVIAHALARGVNFIDLIAWTPDVQAAVGEAIGGRRQEVILAGHLGMAETDGPYRRTRDLTEARQTLEAQLRRLGTDHLDILYCLHNCDEAADLEQMLAPGGFLDAGRQLRDEGVARHLGYSGHEGATALRALAEADLEVVMFPAALDRAGKPGQAELLETCEHRGVGVVGMKAYAGGAIFERCPTVTALHCLAYALSQPAVATLAVGCKTPEQVDAALGYLTATGEQLEFHEALQAAGHTGRGYCVYCNHCQPCPAEIDIAAVHRLLAAAQHGLTAALRAEYAALAAQPDTCIRCEACLERCPFGVDATGNIRRAAELFGAAC